MKPSENFSYLLNDYDDVDQTQIKEPVNPESIEQRIKELNHDRKKFYMYILSEFLAKNLGKILQD